MKLYTALSALAICTVLAYPHPLSAQNLNTTFRSKLAYPGQTLANVWGYTVNGQEYALVGASKGLSIVDITNPDAPQQIVQIPGPDNLWKEIKTYSHYAYVTSEGGGGIQVVDLNGLPSPMLNSHFYTGDGPIAGQLGSIHALHIDETKGFLYAWGGSLFGGSAKVFDLKADPYNPKYVGKFDQLGYIHDGYVDNDTMYSCHIYAGQFAVVNMANKSAPELINTQTTPNAFPHNTWLTPDRKTILATDETTNSFLSAWDVSDPTNIQFLDKIQSNPGSNSIVHNTYAMGHWAVTSWYKDGFTIVDVTRPGNLVQVGNYDTYTIGSGDGFDGCWGVYPFFPSGTLIASNIGFSGTAELWIISPNYTRACYMEGKVTNAETGQPIPGINVKIEGTAPLLQQLSANDGTFKMGQEAEGTFSVHIKKKGFYRYDTTFTLQHGDVAQLNIALVPKPLTFYPLRPGHRSAPVDGEEADDRSELLPTQDYLKVNQNPFVVETQLEYNLPGENNTLVLLNAIGQTLQTRKLDGATGQLTIGTELPAGVYHAVLMQGDKLLEIEKLIKN